MKVFVNGSNKITGIGKTSDESLTEIDIPDGFFDGMTEGQIRCYYCKEHKGHPVLWLGVSPEIFEQVGRTVREAEKLRNQNVLLITAARLAAYRYSDPQALAIPELYPEWADLPDGTQLTSKEEAAEGTEVTIVRHGGLLYRVIQSHKKQADWEPGQATASQLTVINVDHAGTLEDPIPAAANMEYTKGRYYIEDGVIYLMNREGMEDGEGIVLQYLPSQLVGQYFEAVNS